MIPMHAYFPLLLLTLLHLVSSEPFPPPRTVTTYKYTPCVSHFESCTDDCPNIGEPDEYCEYYEWQYCSTLASKKCRCACTKQITLAPCMTAQIEGYASLGTYRLTAQIYGGNNVYKRDPGQGNTRWLYWKSNEWKIGTELGGSAAYSKCAHAQLKDCDGSSDSFQVTECNSLWREDNRCDGNFMADGFPYQPAICNTEGDYPCCGLNNQCGNTAEDCWCETCLNYARMKQSCVLEQVTRIPNFCEITPLDKVDTQLGTEMLWNVQGALAGSLPIVGDIFNVFLAVMDPLGPVTRPSDLINNLIDGVNQQVTALQKCMDQRITNVMVKLIDDNFDAIIRESALCRSYTGDPKKRCIEALSQKFYGRLDVFAERASSYLEYENMLPILGAIYPIWMATVTARLDDLKKDGDGCNFNAFLEAGREGSNILKVWGGTWALDSIVDNLTPPAGFDVDTCKRDVNSNDEIVYTNKDYLYAIEPFNPGNSNLCGLQGREYRQLDVHLKMTKESDHWCQFPKDGSSWFCKDNDSQKCSLMRSRARTIVNTIKNRLEHEYRPAFYKKFLENIDKFSKSLDSVEKEPCSREGRESLLNGRLDRESYHNRTRFSTAGQVYSGMMNNKARRFGSQQGKRRMTRLIPLSFMVVALMTFSGGIYMLLIVKRRWKYERITGPTIMQL